MSNAPKSPFAMMGSVDADACEGDSCLVPVARRESSAAGDEPGDPSLPVEIEPSLEEAAAASARAITAALDQGASL